MEGCTAIAQGPLCSIKSRAMTSNPYEPPSTIGDIGTQVEADTKLPVELLRKTKFVVCGFGFFQFLWPIAVAPFTDSLPIDLFAFFIAANGFTMNSRSFHGFPWTALMCTIYLLAFPYCLMSFDVTSIRNWLPTRFSPVISMQLFSSLGAAASIVAILRCHRYHRSMRREMK